MAGSFFLCRQWRTRLNSKLPTENFFEILVTLYVHPREEAQGSDKGCFRE